MMPKAYACEWLKTETKKIYIKRLMLRLMIVEIKVIICLSQLEYKHNGNEI